MIVSNLSSSLLPATCVWRALKKHLMPSERLLYVLSNVYLAFSLFFFICFLLYCSLLLDFIFTSAAIQRLCYALHSFYVNYVSGWKYGLSISFSFFSCLREKNRNDFVDFFFIVARTFFDINCCIHFAVEPQSISKCFFFFVLFCRRRMHNNFCMTAKRTFNCRFSRIEMESIFNMENAFFIWKTWKIMCNTCDHWSILYS